VDLGLALLVTIFRDTSTCIGGGGGGDKSKHFGEPGCLRLQCRGGEKFWVIQGMVFLILAAVHLTKNLGP
jgi:hypothetical protein